MPFFLPKIWVQQRLAAVALAMCMVLFGALDLKAQAGYEIRPGDTVRVEVLEDPALNRDVVVLPDGNISFPFAGTLRAAGRTLPQLQDALTNSIASNFANRPNVFVSLPTAPVARGAATIEIYFLGEVSDPGLVKVAPGTTFLQALALSGGPTPFAATKRVQLRRTDPRTQTQKVYKIDYNALTRGAALRQDIRLQDGDVILVPERRLFE